MIFETSDEMLREVNCSEIMNLAAQDDRIVVLDADLMNSSGFSRFMKSYPSRSIDCGIQEANMIGVAGGLSSVGMIPIVHTFASFAGRRVVDQIFMAGVYNRQNIKIFGSDPGIINCANGGTHMGFEDIGIMRSMPGITIVDPADEVALKAILPEIIDAKGVYYIRLFRKTKTRIYGKETKFSIGKATLAREGKDLTIIAEGAAMVPEALLAADILSGKGINARVLDMFTIKPIDAESIVSAALETGVILTVENHNIFGGLGSAVAEVLAKANYPVVFDMVGFPDTVGETGTLEYIKKKYGLDCQTIAKKAQDLLFRKRRLEEKRNNHE